MAAAVDAGFAAFNAALLTAAQDESDPVTSLEAMGLAYLAFAERQPALYAILFSARRPLGPKSQARDEGFAGLVALLRASDPALDAAEAREIAIAVWSSLHGFAILRAARPELGWPSAEDYVRRTLAAHVPRDAS